MIPNCAHALLADIVSPFVCHDDELTRDTFGLQKQVEGAKPAMKHCKLNSGIAPMIAPPHCRLPALAVTEGSDDSALTPTDCFVGASASDLFCVRAGGFCPGTFGQWGSDRPSFFSRCSSNDAARTNVWRS